MQYLLSVIDRAHDGDGAGRTAAVDAFDSRLQLAGHRVFGGDLGEPGTATVVDCRGVGVTITDGPFVETSEWVAGFWVVEAPDLDEALRLAAAGSRVWHRRVEVRPFR